MAHPVVEKLKEAGILYGDKVAVAVTSLIFVVCLGLAFSMKSIDVTPEQVKEQADRAQSNLAARQEEDRIIQVLESSGIKSTQFAKQVEEAAKTVLVADNYKPDREWVTPEPGAGLIRDEPTLIALTQLYAYPGRGGALVYDLDESGERKIDTEKKELPKEQPKTSRRSRRNQGGMMGGGMMGGGGRRGARAKSQAEIEREQKQEADRKQREITAKLAGRDAPAEETKGETNAEDKTQKDYKEITKGVRWVAITGILDHAALVANYRQALKGPTTPHYARLELQRQTRQEDGSWSDWEKVNEEENYKILDNLPEWDDELTPDTVRPPNLNDPLPFLKAGLWEKVHIASLVPKEKKEVTPPPSMGGGAGGMGGMGGGYGSPSSMSSGDYAKSMAGSMMNMQNMMRSMKSGGGYPGMGGGYGSAMTGGGDVGNYWKSDEKRVMVRALDFTAEPDNDYRYRVRIVVYNPNYKRDDVNHGVNKKDAFLEGPWSDPTDEIHMPADSTAYALSTIPGGAKSDMKVWFQVVKFDEGDGVTVPRRFAAGPGELIGDASTADIPSSEGTGKKSKTIDFNTRQLVLDAAGGPQPLPTGIPGGSIERPVLSLLLRPDGSVLARSQADDVANEVRVDIERNYAREIKESNTKRESSMGGGYGGMMGGYGGMGGGMMGGGMMGGGRR